MNAGLNIKIEGHFILIIHGNENVHPGSAYLIGTRNSIRIQKGFDTMIQLRINPPTPILSQSERDFGLVFSSRFDWIPDHS